MTHCYTNKYIDLTNMSIDIYFRAYSHYSHICGNVQNSFFFLTKPILRIFKTLRALFNLDK